MCAPLHAPGTGGETRGDLRGWEPPPALWKYHLPKKDTFLSRLVFWKAYLVINFIYASLLFGDLLSQHE